MLHLFNQYVWCYACDRFVVVASHSLVQRSLQELDKPLEKLRKSLKDADLSDKMSAQKTASEDDVINANAPGVIGQKPLFGTSAEWTGDQSQNGRGLAVSPTAAEPSAKRHKQNSLIEQSAFDDGHKETGAIRGLSNLGNTCFFNSVMQCLAQTHPLIFVLNEELPDLQLLQPTEPLSDNRKLNPLKVKMEGGRGYLTYALMKFLETFHDSGTHKAAISPGELFNEIRKKAPRFAGWSQQDSHELLRYLMDGLHTEEEKRVHRALAVKYNIGETPKMEKLDPKIAEEFKAYASAANATVVQRVFGGKLLQLIRCARCKHISPRLEPFLDLSLPISDPKINGDDNPDKHLLLDYGSREESMEPAANNPLSKHLLKKQRKDMKKKARRTARRAARDTSESNLESAISNELDHSLSLDEDAHVDSDDNDEALEQHNLRSLMETVQPADRTQYNSAFNVGSCLRNFTSIEWLSGKNQFGCAHCYKLENANATGQESSDGANETAGTSGSGPQGMVAKITKRRSIQSPNKSSKPRVVYTDAAKRYLIYRPPCVLTLHLKRFQNMGFMTRKWSRPVEFPCVLDLAPYTCRHGEDTATADGRILYSLYGVVVHMGSMGGGHYVAYVKLRNRNPALARAFLMNATDFIRDERQLLLRESELELLLEDAAGGNAKEKFVNCMPGVGKWLVLLP